MTMGRRWRRRNWRPSTDSRWGKRRCGNGCGRPDCGRRGGRGWNESTCGGRDGERAGAELLQWDTSTHDWLEGRGPRLYLIALIDDATSQATARFVDHDSTEENLRMLGSYVQAHGRPLAVYTDKASLFQTAPKAVHHRQAPAQQPTQIGRALAELDIEWIAAHSPQAKGRVERFFGTAQDRLVKGLRKVGASNREQANRYLEQVYLPLWNQRFTCAAEQAGDAHRALDRRLELEFGAEPGGSADRRPGLHRALGRGDVSDPAGRHRRRDAWPAGRDRTAPGSDAMDALEATASPVRPLRGGKETQLSRCLEAAPGRAKTRRRPTATPSAATQDSL